VHGDAPGHDGTGEKCNKRRKARRDGEAFCSGHGETDEDDVASHVGDEDVTQAEEGHTVEKATHDGEACQRRHEVATCGFVSVHGAHHLSGCRRADSGPVTVTVCKREAYSDRLSRLSETGDFDPWSLFR
jgi:hypothetical protein